jgi:purine-binding chemotaxis protein CheW
LNHHEPPALQAWCLFRIDARPYAVGLESVAEVVEVEGIVRLPLASKRVLGLCVFHREVVPVVSLSDLESTTTGPGQSEPRPLALVLRSEPGTWALRIDRGGTTVAEAPLEDASEPRHAEPQGPILRGTILSEGTPHQVLDSEGTWCNLRDALQRWYRGDLGPSHCAALPRKL